MKSFAGENDNEARRASSTAAESCNLLSKAETLPGRPSMTVRERVGRIDCEASPGERWSAQSTHTGAPRRKKAAQPHLLIWLRLTCDTINNRNSPDRRNSLPANRS